MKKTEAIEAAAIMQRTLARLLGVAPTVGRVGSNLRTACGVLSANAAALIQSDSAGPPLAACFDLAWQTGVTQPQLSVVLDETAAETTLTSGATLIKWSIIGMILATEGRAIAAMTFSSREDVDALKLQMNLVFNIVEEATADEMDQMTYRAMMTLHAAIIAFLVDTARPLPRLLNYAFASTMPTLVLAYRLYADASRADELLDENKVVHPAFPPPTGIALSS